MTEGGEGATQHYKYEITADVGQVQLRSSK